LARPGQNRGRQKHGQTFDDGVEMALLGKVGVGKDGMMGGEEADVDVWRGESFGEVGR
jgi:hypothetical protein